MLGTIVPSI